MTEYTRICKEDDIEIYRLEENVISSGKYRFVLMYKGIYLKNVSKGYWYSLDLNGGQLKRFKLAGQVKILERTLL